MLSWLEPPEFAKNLLDFNRLMEGENRQSTHPDDADHWYAVYSDLVGFKEQLLGEIRAHIRQVPESKPELGEHDVPFLEAELGRLRSGQAYWGARRNRPGKKRAR